MGWGEDMDPFEVHFYANSFCSHLPLILGKETLFNLREKIAVKSNMGVSKIDCDSRFLTRFEIPTPPRVLNRCSVCFSESVNILFFPCHHAACCGVCSSNLEKCPICTSHITAFTWANIRMTE